ncbi:hypothetical protein PGTUg99_005787 [Puccinia graminis f. sp. tritici]|uniref:Secreted protein n=1 Tax=Puccinia graminis f. sp. tritici TaxID=56615 RepID=A0A5B0RUT8_PUCGR|nr:hypothetical protein PGTUg99_005787 [Puccinia graminis f. sp. tritici]
MFGFSAVSLVALLVSLLQVRTGSALPTPQFVPVGMPIVINPAPIVPARQVVPMVSLPFFFSVSFLKLQAHFPPPLFP